MRVIFLIIGWVLTIGALVNVAMAAAALYFIGAGGFSDWGMTVETMMREHTTFLAWTRDVADMILPANIVQFFFDSPALVLFPARAIIAGVLGSWALKAGRRRKSIIV
ncbi:MAG: hypothetical protein KDA46_06340 [Parvularculaceae bacterium]|nr:hypothetical protein [Parvularculaceae bacterium]